MRSWSYFKICRPERETDITHFNSMAFRNLFSSIKKWEEMNPQIDRPSPLPAGYTYLGQLIDHDLSFLRQTDGEPELRPRLKIDQLWQARRPALDLDTIYGAGIDDSAARYDLECGKFILGKTLPISEDDEEDGLLRDLPRNPVGQALIADSRNDQHLLISQMQVLWMSFHNKIIDHYISEGYSGAEELFRLARNEVIQTYHYIVFKDFCRRILPTKIYEEILIKGNFPLTKPSKNSPTISLEFASAAFRLHSLVCNGYITNQTEEHGTIFISLTALFKLTGRRAHRQFFLHHKTEIVNWHLLFDSEHNLANPFSTNIVRFEMPTDPVKHEVLDMRKRTAKRGYQISLATGQELFRFVSGLHPAFAQKIGLQEPPLTQLRLREGNPGYALTIDTPLWIYLMLEARMKNHDHPHCLGNLGGWVVADSLRSAKHSTADKFSQDWSIEKSIAAQSLIAAGHPSFTDNTPFTMKDLVTFTYGK